MKQTLLDNKQIERSKERGIIVYVCPTKALINQVVGDIYKRYGPVFGQLTLDYNQKVFSCEVLVTIPECFEQLLLSPQREGWIKQIRYVIFDEIHNIASDRSGSIWERCLAMITCPFLALSATVGNPGQFQYWLARVEALRNRKVSLIQHSTRWSDLEKHIYLPQHPKLPDKQTPFALKDIHSYKSAQSALNRIHPTATLRNLNFSELRRFPSELEFTPRDSLSLYEAALKQSKELPAELQVSLQRFNPDVYFSGISIDKQAAMNYEKLLKSELTKWLETGHFAAVQKTVNSLSGDLQDRVVSMENSVEVVDDCYSTDFQRRHLLPLLAEINSADKLPAIVFCLAADLCQQLLVSCLDSLELMQERAREDEKDEESEKQRAKEREKLIKQMKRLRDKQQKDKSKEEEARYDDLSQPTVIEEEVDEFYDIDDRFSFIRREERMDSGELDYWILRMLYKTGWKRNHPLVRALYRGIGIHHAGLVKAYRDLVETLFRGKHIKVVIATSTLSVGINMPCKSVIFCGDHKTLNPLLYRQMAGRSGRRGYDNIGHVVFFAVPPRKINHLLIAPLQSLKGHFPITSTLALRQVNYFSNIKDANYAYSVLSPLIREPFFAQTYPGRFISEQIKFHLRYCIEYLFQRALINNKGESIGLSALVQFMSEAEPNNYAFVALLESGYIRQLCANFSADKLGVARDLLQLLAHLFMTVPIPAHKTKEALSQAAIDAGAQLILQPLPQNVQQIINTHNESTLKTFTNYVRSFAKLQLAAGTAQAAPSSSSANLVADNSAVSSTAAAPQPKGGKKGGKIDPRAPISVNTAQTTATAAKLGKTPAIGSSVTESTVELPPAPIQTADHPVYEQNTQLPVSGVEFPSAWNTVERSLADELMQNSVTVEARSPFVALSGHSDDIFRSARELADTVRNGIYLESSLLPVCEYYDGRGRAVGLSSYIVDFYRQGSLELLVNLHKFKDLEAWNRLKDWSLLLRKITQAAELLAKEKDKDTVVQTLKFLQSNYDQLFTAIPSPSIRAPVQA
jgi:hypothetical protein